MASSPSSLVFKVQRREPELIKPAKPTPHEFKLLSDIDDQEGLRFHIPLIQLYRHNPSVQGKDPVKVIREAIAKTLVFLLSICRLREGHNRKLMVECTGEGILFIEADADVTLEQFGDPLQPPFPCLEELLFDVPGSSGVLNCPLLLIQHVYANLACNEKHFGFIGDLNSSLLLLAVGTKLEHVITQLAYEVAEKHVAIEGELVVKPSDNHFWFHRPGFVHLLIHFILFQNAFEIAFFFWIWVQYGFDSCIMGQIKYIVPRLIIGVFIQVLCSYSTLPLYALVSQMGSTFKKSIFEEHVQVGLVGWAQKLERLKGLKEANEGSAQSSSHEGSTLGNNASAPPFPREAEP
ncbi:LOW QUALITY PROTEIN: hypothetical protein NC652_030401 [Populus alba x Populus x berolinensis]|nr:LOW QUALITY PROTEIN: hypothetical protein NC652_030401 [Populus alba x Populus x berolinensis]